MKKKIKNLKYIFLKKKNLIKNVEKTLIQKSINSNFKLENYKRIMFLKKKKKKIISSWQNCCFTLGLFKKQNSKMLMSRFTIKLQNNLLNIPNIRIKTW